MMFHLSELYLGLIAKELMRYYSWTPWIEAVQKDEGNPCSNCILKSDQWLVLWSFKGYCIDVFSKEVQKIINMLAGYSKHNTDFGMHCC